MKPVRNCQTCGHLRECSLVKYLPKPRLADRNPLKLPPLAAKFLPMPCGGVAWTPQTEEPVDRPLRFFEDLAPAVPVDPTAIPIDLELNDKGLPR